MRNSSGAKPPRQLLASIHDVSPLFEAAVDRLSDRLQGHLGAARFAMLVVPDFWDQAPLSRAPGFRARLRSWADIGVEMFVHGWNHRDDQVHSGRWASFKARRMTAREGEFLGLDGAEARRRMREGRAIIEDAIGRPVAGFIAPAWLYGEGARRALAEENFALAEDHLRVWRPSDGAILSRGPVVTWASRSRARKACSIGFAGVARTLMRSIPVVRLAVHPGDAACPTLMASIDMTVSAFSAGREPARYRDLMGT